LLPIGAMPETHRPSPGSQLRLGRAGQAFDTPPAPTLETLFTEARSQNGWQDRPLPEGMAQALYALARWAPTSANCNPGRFVFLTSAQAKERLRPALSSGNLANTMARR
jgi:3-hydroxypropanoate dehydrogenase